MDGLRAVGERRLKSGLSCGHLGSFCSMASGRTLSWSGPHHPNLKTTKGSHVSLLYPPQRKGLGRRFLRTREMTRVAVS